MAHEETLASRELRRLLLESTARPLIVPGWSGNHGDRLIWLGLLKAVRTAGLKPTYLPRPEFEQDPQPPARTILLMAGGGFHSAWYHYHFRARMEALLRNPGVSIVAPASVESVEFVKQYLDEPLRKARCERLVIMAREPISYQILLDSVPSHVEVVLDHDPALNLVPEDLPRLARAPRGTLFAVRYDREMKHWYGLNPLRFWIDPTKLATFEHWLAVHQMAETIVANRLHSSVLGSILGRRVRMFAGGYHKQRGVWELSLRDRGVEWLDALEPGPLATGVGKLPGVARLYRGRRLHRLLAALHAGPAERLVARLEPAANPIVDIATA